MPDLITIPDDAAEIRALIDPSLSAANLPDTTIAFDAYRGRAQREVQALTDDTGPHAKLAAKLICAAYLTPIVPKLLSEHIPGASYQRQSTNWRALAEDLRSQSQTEIALANNETTDAQFEEQMPTIFTVASRCDP